MNSDGVFIDGIGANSNIVEGNYIGTDVTGTVSFGNGDGVLIDGGAANNMIGGTTSGTGNLISGNYAQVVLTDAGTTGNQVAGNLVGTNASGTAVLPEYYYGIQILSGASSNTIGGTSSASRNVIDGVGYGIDLQSSSTTGTVIEGNYIGTDITGLVGLGNYFGIDVEGAPNTTIGGSDPSARNVISGNVEGVNIGGTGTIIEGNYIGVGSDGATAVGNSDFGIAVGTV